MTLTMAPSAQIELWRQKVRDGTITNEELREAIRLLREGRLTASAKPRTARTATAKNDTMSQDATEDLLKELGDMV